MSSALLLMSSVEAESLPEITQN